MSPRTPAPARLALAAFVTLALLAVSFALADDPAAWTAGGIPVAVGEADQTRPMLVADGAGGAIIAWEDHRPGASGVCVQHLTSLGTPAPGWSAPGVLLAGAREPWLAADGARNAILSWMVSDYVNLRRIVNGEPFAPSALSGATSVRRVGPAQSGNTRDPALPTSDQKVPHNEMPIVIADGAGGLLMGWMRLSLIADKLIFQRLDAASVPAAPWVYVHPNSYGDRDPSMCSDDSTGTIFAWVNWYPQAIYAQRVLSDGAPAPAWPAGGLVVSGGLGTRRATGIVPDGAGGAIIVWRDGRNGSFEQIYAQRVTHDGAIAAGWPEGGRAICTYAVDAGDSRSNGSYDERSSPLAADGAGGAFIVWSDMRADSGDIYCQHLLPDGSLAAGWPENGVALCAAEGLQSRPEIVADGAGGAIACWEDARSGEADVYVQRVGADGALAPGWPKAGLAVCVAPGEQRVPQLVSDGGTGAIVAWQDRRNGNADIYAAHVTGDERRAKRATRVPAAAPRSSVSRPATVEGAATSDRGETRPDVAEAPHLALGALYPNPSPGEVRVSFMLPEGGGGSLELVDLSGRAIETHALDALGPGAHVMRLTAGRNLPPGLYCVRLTRGGSALTARLAIVR